MTALITFGEGYHSFHHRFQSDYRTGIRWWDYDPAKWTVWLLARVGLARDLRKTSREAITAARASAVPARLNARPRRGRTAAAT